MVSTEAPVLRKKCGRPNGFSPGKKLACGALRCPAAIRLNQHVYYVRDKPKRIAQAKSIPDEKKREYRKRWKQKNGARVLLHGRMRKRDLKQAAPAWLTHDQWAEMNSMYEEAQRLSKESGRQYHVDHIIPLRGGKVCGLHVPWNLRVIGAQENMRRSRVFNEEDIP